MSLVVFDPKRDGAALDALLDASAPDTSLAPSVRDAWLRFAALVSTWGQRTDLVAAPTAAALVEILFLDALALLPLLPEGARVLDVGAGAGAPALPVLLARDDLRGVLLEPRRRRVAFMRTAVGALGLSSRAEVIEGWLADDATEAPGGPADVALSRATFPPDEWLARGSHLAPRVLVLLGRGAAPARPGWALVTERSYVVPSSGASRRVLAYEATP